MSNKRVTFSEPKEDFNNKRLELQKPEGANGAEYYPRV